MCQDRTLERGVPRKQSNCLYNPPTPCLKLSASCRKDFHCRRDCKSKTTTSKPYRAQPSALPLRVKGLQIHWVTNILENSHPKLFINIGNKNKNVL